MGRNRRRRTRRSGTTRPGPRRRHRVERAGVGEVLAEGASAALDKTYDLKLVHVPDLGAAVREAVEKLVHGDGQSKARTLEATNNAVLEASGLDNLYSALSDVGTQGQFGALIEGLFSSAKRGHEWWRGELPVLAAVGGTLWDTGKAAASGGSRGGLAWLIEHAGGNANLAIVLAGAGLECGTGIVQCARGKITVKQLAGRTARTTVTTTGALAGAKAGAWAGAGIGALIPLPLAIPVATVIGAAIGGATGNLAADAATAVVEAQLTKRRGRKRRGRR